MLIYEKKVQGVNHLFGTTNSVPSEDDVQLTYKDNAGDVVADIDTLKFFYEKAQCIYGNESTRQIPTDSDEKINVWLGDQLIIGNVVTHKLTKNSITHVTISLPSEVAEGAEATLSVSAKSGYKFTAAPTATANGEAITLTEDSGAYTATLTVMEDIAVVVTATVEPDQE